LSVPLSSMPLINQKDFTIKAGSYPSQGNLGQGFTVDFIPLRY
jgi:hypothetical protein